ncbi:MAG: 23S rRNA (uracil(1939)-C(5))-methyltransferase RlmD [Chlamydiales bacterium]|nr:23S rRNA (uracil(1939)-C(5))-methyltransferase RlmD [Chlamydiales bacterium]
MNLQSIPLEITSLNAEGLGKAAWSGPDGLVRQVTIANTLPGEKAVCDLFHCKSKKIKGLLGKVVEITEPSPLRIAPTCKHFGTCGGCTWQHLPYDEQVEIKENTLRDLFSDVVTPDTIFYPIIGCPTSYCYRNKMEFSFSQDLKGQKFLGLMMRASRGRVFNLEECFLVNPWVSQTVNACREWWHQSSLDAYYPPKSSGHLRNLTMREAQTTGDRVIILTVSGNPDYPMKQAHLDSFVQVCKAHATPKEGATLSCILRIQQCNRGQETQFFEMMLFGPDGFRERVKVGSHELEFRLSPSSFFQPNSKQASRIYERALELAGLRPDMVLYDLYAGIGVFGMCAAHLVKEVISIEISADSAYDAKVNSDRLKLTNYRIIKSDVAKALLDQSLPKADVVIVDPPRTGLGPSAISNIVSLNPKTIVYVSCNPKTQKIDLQELITAGYQVTAIQPIDQFPQTIHVENVVILSRETSNLS